MENSQQNSKIVLHSKKKMITIAVVVLIIALVATASGLLITSKNPTNNQTTDQVANQNNPQSWIKIGAYATYKGQATILTMTVTFDAKMEIVNLNETHIQVLTDFNMSTPYGATENTTTTWVSRENMTFQPNGLTLNNTYSTQITLPNLGTRSCTVYEYNGQGISAAYYVDNKIQWPIKMVMRSPPVDGQSYSMDINLVDTNIRGL
ncbi:MAG: hypothetical protein ABSF44_13100 [Candidatus Bathyarchaeia archaeon]